ncbi:MAG: hypothetical protein GXP26_17145 [Planctomycetes bacterium]|nr:hypothetical protein [Planctomycetota bacterium]
MLRQRENKNTGKFQWKWRCYSCEIQKKKFDTLIGLVRLFVDCSPVAAFNKLVDVARKPAAQMNKIVPFPDIGQYRHRALIDIPPHYLWWVYEKESFLPEKFRDLLQDFLFSDTSQSLKSPP